jgi:hypothetical protein
MADPFDRSTRKPIPIRIPRSGELNAGVVIGILIVIDGRAPFDRSTRKPIPIRIPRSGELNAGIGIGILIVIDGLKPFDRSTRKPIPIRIPRSEGSPVLVLRYLFLEARISLIAPCFFLTLHLLQPVP